jgi:hypothetical protein
MLARAVERTLVRLLPVTAALAETDLLAWAVMARAAMTAWAVRRKVVKRVKGVPAKAGRAGRIRTRRELLAPARATPAR